MSSRHPPQAAGKPASGRTEKPDRAIALTAGSRAVPRVGSRELLREGEQLIIEHAGREYRLRVTSNGKLILTA